MNFPEPPENPYAATVPQISHDPTALPIGSGLVNQVMVVGILQIVIGVMELLMGGLLLFYAVFFSFIMPNMENQGGNVPPPEAMLWLSIGCGVGGVIVLAVSILRIVAGIYSFWFKQRTLMLASLIGGMVTILTCYCSLFSLGIGIYGLIVMIDPAVRLAYRLSADGVPAALRPGASA